MLRNEDLILHFERSHPFPGGKIPMQYSPWGAHLSKIAELLGERKNPLDSSSGDLVTSPFIWLMMSSEG